MNFSAGFDVRGCGGYILIGEIKTGGVARSLVDELQKLRSFSMKIITAAEVHAALKFPDLIDSLQEAFAADFTMPPRKVFLLDEDDGNHDAFALLPSWNDSVIGVKAFTYFPDNPKPEYESLYSKILLFDRAHGEPLALVDGTSVTFLRTAAVSGLASRLLSRANSETLLLLGTGNLATYIIRAQASVRNLKRVLVWGRTPANAQKVVQQMNDELTGIEWRGRHRRQRHRITRPAGPWRLDYRRHAHRLHRQSPCHQTRVRHRVGGEVPRLRRQPRQLFPRGG